MQGAVLRQSPERPDACSFALLPSSDAMLDRVAVNFCLAIRPLFQADPASAPVLVASLQDPAARRMWLRCWDRGLRERDLLLNPVRRRDQSIIRTATILADLLSSRWPEPVRPTRIGVLSDGTGVAIAPEDPCPASPGWIARRLADPRGLISVKRFAPEGGLALLQTPRADRRAPH